MRTSLLGILLLGLCGSISHTPALVQFQVHNNAAAATFWFYQNPTELTYQNYSEPVLRRLARVGAAPAQVLLSQLLLHQGDLGGARLHWQQALDGKGERRVMLQLWQQLAQAMVQQGQWQALGEINRAYTLPDELEYRRRFHLGLEVGADGHDYARQLGFGTDLHRLRPQACRYNLLLLGDSLAAMHKLQQLRGRYLTNPEPKAGLFCLSEPQYLGDALDCQYSADSFGRCDWRPLAHKPTKLPPGFDFIVMVTGGGLANVQGGIMHLGVSAPYHVFMHELLHFSGFTDEYPAPPAQQSACEQSGRVYANLFVGEQAPPGWAPSAYCGNGRGYKPSAGQSLMEQSEVGVTPLYRRLWLAELARPGKHIRFADFFYRLSGETQWREYRDALDNKSDSESL
ncbi:MULTISPECIES: hypothetical protein [unclassified Pseudoalteromonas]|uniref:hypothetical protein n=1 Tax=unclassified Pseudoalteromonas TaxID=194690 RepID=UPI000CF70733|nr:MULTISPECIES: hypothetical protein [unclassified Pseudoalteromonas]MBS3796328.1 hypothetical protein [Pseudoalteromonas sp. BDTF-M6]